MMLILFWWQPISLSRGSSIQLSTVQFVPSVLVPKTRQFQRLVWSRREKQQSLIWTA